MEEFKNFFTKIMSYTIFSFELKFKPGRAQKDIGPDFMSVAMEPIPVIPLNSVEFQNIQISDEAEFD